MADAQASAMGGPGSAQSTAPAPGFSSAPSVPTKLFIGGLAWDVNEEGIRSYFSAFGEVSEAIIPTDSMTGKGKGFGFVTMSGEAGAEAVMSGGPHTLGDKTVEMKRAVERGQAPPPRSASGSGTFNRLEEMGNKMFVGGLPQELNEAEYSAYFSQFGSLSDQIIMRDRETGITRGFGFITFDHNESVQKCLAGNPHTLKGQTVEVKVAVPRGQSAPPAHQGSSPRGMGPQYPAQSGQEAGKIFVGGLANTLTEEELQGFFERFGQVTSVTIMKDKMTGKSRGFGFVDFAAQGAAQEAADIRRHEIGGRNAEAKLALPKGAAPPPRLGTDGQPLWTYRPSPAMGGGGYGQPQQGGTRAFSLILAIYTPELQ